MSNTLNQSASGSKKTPTSWNTLKAGCISVFATLLLSYGSAQASEQTAYWPPADETFTENSLSVQHVGSAMRYRGNKTVYIASLYSQDEFPNTAVLYSNDGAKELQFIIMDESMSYRRLQRILKNDLLVTLQDDEYTDLQPKIQEMLTALKTDYRIGSLVTLAYDPLRDATIVRVDGDRKATIDGKELFNANLKAMVGERPPSRHFKSELLGQRPSVIDIAPEQELLLTQYMDKQLNKSLYSSPKEEWVVNSDIHSEF